MLLLLAPPPEQMHPGWSVSFALAPYRYKHLNTGAVLSSQCVTMPCMHAYTPAGHALTVHADCTHSHLRLQALCTS